MLLGFCDDMSKTAEIECRFLTLRRIRCTLRKSKIPDRMRGCWDRKVTGTHILVNILCLRENNLVVFYELKLK